LHRITRAIADRQDLPSIFQVVIRSLEEDLPIDFGCVLLYEAPQDVLTVASVGEKSEAQAKALDLMPGAPIPGGDSRLESRMRGELFYESDISQLRSPLLERLSAGGFRALVASPLVVEERVFGVLLAARRARAAFTSGDCEFLRHLSEHVALAAHQTRLYTALQRAYDDLRQTQESMLQEERLRALGQMASGIAHDINNAISPIALYAELLLRKEPNLTERSRQHLEVIGRSIDDVAATVARMREFYRPREPQLMLEPVSLNLLVQHVAELTRARWSDMALVKGVVIDMQTDLTPDLPDVMGVEGEIREALTNLVFNAVDAMPEGGVLTLRTRVAVEPVRTGFGAPSRVACLEVADTGVGMDEATRRRCLEPFFTTKGKRGTGLGLAMVYGMVQRHSASIEIESAPGAGTTVRLRFAVPAMSIAEAPLADASPHALEAMRILIIDDDPFLLGSLRDVLENDGHSVFCASSGQAGVDAFRAAYESGEPFALVLTDLSMPHMDGGRVAIAIKMISASTPVILLTGWGQRMIDGGEVPLSVDLVLSKPPRLQEIRDALAQWGRTSDPKPFQGV
ncbi:MAG: ATP-binding protein, partial [Opitutaceae bacterium]